ncbi:hypothetical protein IEO21_05453 [Rhodonia placenta]|uniref:Protein kinase domain-containing protein n=2 Tax=Rhodonia placenta TaxID=104341 RepID=A0A8H7P201_9APHY|nr:hypothetical protein IEO21_05453 [Postia placenta]
MESSNLQVPDTSQPGPSRHAARPASVQPTSSSASPAATRKRASHTVVTSQPQQEEQPAYRDIYSHPAALEYAAAHPRRTIPKFGPYLLLQTLGEGEFGKVKLGLHIQYGEEVAVKLIRRGNIDTTVRMSKVEREIEVLRSLKHPNIVRLYDVIETDKYIGIILEYASGGELFDHILAHRYLREKDACKLFSQLISGVWYIHQKKIVHRDLKLENLLLDRHRNVIITDFGFANRFEHRADDLMQTSCGSPCYAAPELVISDGLYVGSAVDIWSCGVILYAMLAGYLPFDDDPANPDGDNINLLYKYIVNTALSFPDYISAEARDLLSIMLVPDPTRRADLTTIMTHPWLSPYAILFEKSVSELERTAMEQHHQKRLAYQRQMKQTQPQDTASSKISRSHSARTDYSNIPVAASPSRSRATRDQPAQREYLYEASPDQSVYSTSAAPSASRRAFNSAIVLPTGSHIAEDDPFAPASQDIPVPMVSSPLTGTARDARDADVQDGNYTRKSSTPAPTIAPVKTSPENKRQKDGFRHTIQVEYGESDSQPTPQKGTNSTANGTHTGPSGSVRERERRHRRPSVDAAQATEKSLPAPPESPARQRSQTVSSTAPASPPTVPPAVSIEVTGPPVSPIVSADEKPLSKSEKTDSTSSKQSRHRRGLSIDKIGITKLFSSGEQSNGSVTRVPSQNKKNGPGRTSSTDTISKGDVNRRPSTLQVPVSPVSPTAADTSTTSMLSPDGASKKSRRNTLTVMVEPISRSFKARPGRRVVTGETPVSEKPPAAPAVPPKSANADIGPPATPSFGDRSRAEMRAPPSTAERLGVPASTVKASRVMQWFRSKSKGRAATDDESEKAAPEIETVPRGTTPSPSVTIGKAAAPSAMLTPTSENTRSSTATGHPIRSPSTNTEASIGGTGLRIRWIGGGAPKATRAYPDIRTHHGPLDQTTVTTDLPPEVMKHVRKVLEGMGVEIVVETEYKYRCVRPKKRKQGNGVGLGIREGTGNGLAAFSMTGSAASNGVGAGISFQVL